MAITVSTSGPTSTSPTGHTVLRVCQEVAKVVGLQVPDTVMGSDVREHIELASVANEVARRIAFDSHDWTKLKYVATLTGDGVSENTPLPDDYRRMVKKAHVWPSSNPMHPMTHYADADLWVGLDVSGLDPAFGAWTLIGDQMYIKPILGDGASVKFVYISSLYVSGEDTSEFTADEDTFVLDHRVLKLGMVWQWKANKGLAYAEDMATYETALAMAIGSDKGTNVLTVGRRRNRIPDARLAYPGTISDT